MAENVIIKGGNAYRLDGKTLQTAAVLVDGSVDTDWGAVAFDCIADDEKAQCKAIAGLLELGWHGKANI